MIGLGSDENDKCMVCPILSVVYLSKDALSYTGAISSEKISRLKKTQKVVFGFFVDLFSKISKARRGV